MEHPHVTQVINRIAEITFGESKPVIAIIVNDGEELIEHMALAFSEKNDAHSIAENLLFKIPHTSPIGCAVIPAEEFHELYIEENRVAIPPGQYQQMEAILAPTSWVVDIHFYYFRDNGDMLNGTQEV